MYQKRIPSGEPADSMFHRHMPWRYEVMSRPSIRRKITFGYFAVILLISVLSVITLVEIGVLKQKMIFGTTVREFLDTILELRRYEKSYLLYQNRDDFREAVRFIDQAQDLLTIKNNRSDALASPDRIQALQGLFVQYKTFLDQHVTLVSTPSFELGSANVSRKNMFEYRIRTLSDSIMTASLEIEREYRHGLIRASDAIQRIILFSIVAVSLIAVGVGRVLSRIALRPLRRIEQTMDEVARGQFDRIRVMSRDQEVLSLTRAFNRMIRELDRRQRHLVQSEKLASLGTLLSGVAHELNNPLWNISSSNQILMEKAEDSTVEFRREHLAQIDEQTDRARMIIQSLLEFSRNGNFRKQVLPLKALLAETVRLVRGQVPNGVKIQLDIPGDLSITADKQRMQQLFMNLLKNSGEAITGEGAITIRAWTRLAVDKGGDDTEIINYLKYRGKCTSETDTVDIEVRDTGQGIPPDNLPKIFDPFFTTKDIGKGAGLGLFIVHEIVEEHDGCVAVDSAPDRGTAFLIRLPATPVREQDPAEGSEQA